MAEILEQSPPPSPPHVADENDNNGNEIALITLSDDEREVIIGECVIQHGQRIPLAVVWERSGAYKRLNEAKRAVRTNKNMAFVENRDYFVGDGEEYQLTPGATRRYLLVVSGRLNNFIRQSVNDYDMEMRQKQTSLAMEQAQARKLERDNSERGIAIRKRKLELDERENDHKRTTIELMNAYNATRVARSKANIETVKGAIEIEQMVREDKKMTAKQKNETIERYAELLEPSRVLRAINNCVELEEEVDVRGKGSLSGYCITLEELHAILKSYRLVHDRKLNVPSIDDLVTELSELGFAIGPRLPLTAADDHTYVYGLRRRSGSSSELD